jgi:2-(1,2-epoxy-1,2-dihydrophenyl)acetyl-CoA isomerase
VTDAAVDEDAVARRWDGPLAEVALDRPEALNAFTPPMLRALSGALEEALEREETRVLVLAGEGPAFCAGGDVDRMAEHADALDDYLWKLTGLHHPIVRRLREADLPVVTCVDGVAAGGGLGLALCGDVRLGSPEALFQAAYPDLGVVPDGGVTYLLPRAVGQARAERMLLLDEGVEAHQARDWGLLHRVVGEGVREEARALARDLADRDAHALARTKALLDETWNASLGEQLDRERRWNADAGTREGVREAVEAFSAGDKP